MGRSKIIAIFVAVAAVCGSCAEKHASQTRAEPPSETQTGLLTALARVRATDSTRKAIEYGHVAQTRALVDIDRKRFEYLHGNGFGDFRMYAKKVAKELAFDPLSFREAIVAGSPPKWSGIMLGDYDVDAVDKRFADLGIQRSERDGATIWTTSANGDIRYDGPLVQIAGPFALNNVRTRPGSLAYAPFAESLSWVTEPGGDTLAGDPKIRALAECLGDVVVARFGMENGFQPELVAAGVRVASATDVTDVICVAPGSKERAEELRRHASEELRGPADAVKGKPWSELLPAATIELTGADSSVVRVTAQPGADRYAGQVLYVMLVAGMSELFGFR